MYSLPPQIVEFVRPEGFLFEKVYEGEEKRLLLDVFNKALTSYISNHYGFFASNTWEDTLNAFKEVYKVNRKGIIASLKNMFGKLVVALKNVIDNVGDRFEFKFLGKVYMLKKEEALDLIHHLLKGDIYVKINNMVISWGRPFLEKKRLKH